MQTTTNPSPRRRGALGWRKMTWVLWAWCLLIIAWVVSAGSSAHCSTQAYQNACQAGTGVAALLILFVGFVGFVFFSLIWFMTRPRAV